MPTKTTFSSITLRASQGAFRFISGASKSAAYKIETPTGTIGVRGTAFDVGITGDQVHVVMVRGTVELCPTNGQCQLLRGLCSYGVMSNTSVEVQGNLRTKGQAEKANFPLMANERALRTQFRQGGGCASTAAAVRPFFNEDRTGDTLVERPGRERQNDNRGDNGGNNGGDNGGNNGGNGGNGATNGGTNGATNGGTNFLPVRQTAPTVKSGNSDAFSLNHLHRAIRLVACLLAMGAPAIAQDDGEAGPDKSELAKSTLHFSRFVFRDVNRNGTYDMGDRPFAGLSVRLVRPDGSEVIAQSNLAGFANYNMSAGNADEAD